MNSAFAWEDGKGSNVRYGSKADGRATRIAGKLWETLLLQAADLERFFAQLWQTLLRGHLPKSPVLIEELVADFIVRLHQFYSSHCFPNVAFDKILIRLLFVNVITYLLTTNAFLQPSCLARQGTARSSP